MRSFPRTITISIYRGRVVWYDFVRGFLQFREILLPRMTQAFFIQYISFCARITRKCRLTIKLLLVFVHDFSKSWCERGSAMHIFRFHDALRCSQWIKKNTSASSMHHTSLPRHTQPLHSKIYALYATSKEECIIPFAILYFLATALTSIHSHYTILIVPWTASLGPECLGLRERWIFHYITDLLLPCHAVNKFMILFFVQSIGSYWARLAWLC